MCVHVCREIVCVCVWWRVGWDGEGREPLLNQWLLVNVQNALRIQRLQPALMPPCMMLMCGCGC